MLIVLHVVFVLIKIIFVGDFYLNFAYVDVISMVVSGCDSVIAFDLTLCRVRFYYNVGHLS